jgi:hypothetical protein
MVLAPCKQATTQPATRPITQPQLLAITSTLVLFTAWVSFEDSHQKALKLMEMLVARQNHKDSSNLLQIQDVTPRRGTLDSDTDLLRLLALPAGEGGWCSDHSSDCSEWSFSSESDETSSSGADGDEASSDGDEQTTDCDGDGVQPDSHAPSTPSAVDK